MRVLLVALDLPTAGEIGSALEREWPELSLLLAESLEEAQALVEQEDVDVVLLGEGSPAGTLRLCESMCEQRAPVILVARRRSSIDMRRAVELGIEDFLWRPFTARDVVRRVRGAIERAGAPRHREKRPLLESGSWQIDYASAQVTIRGERVSLSAAEYSVLYHLSRSPNRVVPYAVLLAKVWGRQYVDDIDVLKVRVERLRTKLGDRGNTRPRIAARQGLGYSFQLDRAVEE